MTDLRDQLARLLDNEPDAPYDIDSIVRSGRRVRRRHHAALATAGTLGAASVTAAVMIPVLSGGGDGAPIRLGVQPSSTPSPTAAAPAGKCYVMAAPKKTLKHDLGKLVRTGKVGTDPTIRRVRSGKGESRILMEVCTRGTSLKDLQGPKSEQQPQPPAGPPYSYNDDPATIASRLGAHLNDRVSRWGLSITFTRPFSQETSTLDSGHPSYFDGNVDVHESSGYGDVGVQVTHAVTELVPFTGECTETEHCTETKLHDGSVLRTGRVDAGKNDVVLTAEVHRPDGVVVQAQQSNYPFGPDAGTQPHGDQPLTMDQLIALAEDDAFTF